MLLYVQTKHPKVGLTLVLTNYTTDGTNLSANYPHQVQTRQNLIGMRVLSTDILDPSEG